MILGLLSLLWWWVAITLLGLACRPLTNTLFAVFPTRGLALSRFTGLFVVGYLAWILASVHVLPFGFFTCWLLTAIVAALNYGWYYLKNGNLRSLLPDDRNELFHQEIVFGACLFLFGFFRMFGPQAMGTEKLPDLSFLSSILRSEWFPPLDVWFSGATINYFYFGHYLVGFLSQLTGTPSAWGFNLGLAMVLSLTAIGAYGLLMVLTDSRRAAHLGMIFLAFMGNLDTARQFIIALAAGAQLWPPQWFNWWQVSRVLVREGLDVTINEFPFWSYILGDLHAHLMALPLSLLVLALAWRMFAGELPHDRKWLVLLAAMCGLVLGAVPATNTWDTPTLAVIFAIAVVAGVIRRSGFNRESWSPAFIILATAAAVAVIAFLPFHRSFHPVGTQGLGVVPSELRSPLGLFLDVHGIFLVALGFVAALPLRVWLKGLSTERRTLAGLAYGLIVIGAALGGSLAIGLLCALVLPLLFLVLHREHDESLRFGIGLGALALLLLLAVEVFYIKDSYGPELRRQNTVFKVYYQVWLLFSVAAAVGIHWLEDNPEWLKFRGRRSLQQQLKILIGAGLLFTVLSASVRYGNLELLFTVETYPTVTMDGAAFLEQSAPGDYAAIQWFNANVTDRPVILEATGEAFSDYGRISGYTGLPTVLGWANHQSIWRDPTWQQSLARTADIETIYRTENVDEAAALIRRYGIQYVFVGRLERTRYGGPGLNKFPRMGEQVFAAHDGVIFRMH